MVHLSRDPKFSIFDSLIFTSPQCMEVGPAGVHGAPAVKPVELDTKIVIEAVHLLSQSMEGVLAQVHRINKHLAL